MKTETFPKMHVSLYVSDIAKSTKFYSTFFGVNPVKSKSDYSKFVLESPSLIISFIQNKARVQQNFGHLGFQVESKEELQNRLQNAQQNNLVSLIEDETACCYAVQDKFWVTDPDGVQWEVYYFHKDVAFNDPKYDMKDESVCCAEPVAEKAQEACCEPNSGCC